MFHDDTYLREHFQELLARHGVDELIHYPFVLIDRESELPELLEVLADPIELGLSEILCGVEITSKSSSFEIA